MGLMCQHIGTHFNTEITESDMIARGIYTEHFVAT